MAENAQSLRFSSFPLLWLAISFAFGIFAGRNLAIRVEILVTVCICSGIIAGVLARRQFSLIFVLTAFAASGSFPYLTHQSSISEHRLKRIYDEQQIISGEPVEVVGTVVRGREAAFDGFFLTIEVKQIIYKNVSQKASGRIRLFAPIQSPKMAEDYARMNLLSGSSVRIACNPTREDSYQNPGVLSKKELLDWQDLDATATLKSPLIVEKLGDPSPWNPIDTIYDVRQNLIAKFREKFNVSTAGVMIASLFGNKYFLDKNTAEVFREGGTFHILVISGLHITFIGGLGILIVGLFTRKKPVQFVIVSTFLWAYTIAVGAEVPVVRASMMFTILFFSTVIYRKGASVNALGACGLVLLVWRPQDLFTPSFQLTFASVAAIIVMGFPLIEKLRSIGKWTPTVEKPFPALAPVWLKRLCETLYWNEAAWEIESKRHVWSANLFKSPHRDMSGREALQRATAFVVEGILISVVVQLWLLPFLVVYFHRVSIFSVLLNLWAGVLIALESFSALIAIGFSLFSDPLALPLVKLTELFNWLLIGFPSLFVQNDWASFRLPVYTGWPSWIYAIYLVPVIVLGYAAYNWNPFAMPAERRERRLNLKTMYAFAGLAVLTGMVIIFHPYSAPRADGRLHIEFLDVGQGDSAFVTFPTGETMLVDGGGRIGYRKDDTNEEYDAEPFEPDVRGIGESVVSEFLWEKGYSKLDYILATHADLDHIQGLNDVARNFKIGSALVGRTPINDPDFDDFEDTLRRREIPVATISRGDRLTFGEVTVEVLYPIETDDPDAVSDNDHSVVLRIVMGSRYFLLTGDIEQLAEAGLVAGRGVLFADLIKVPHHGSRTSSTQEFIDAVGAKYAVISVGRSSPFGHPHPEVVGRWKAAGAAVMTTGERGTISVSTDGKDLKIDKFHSERVLLITRRDSPYDIDS